MGVSRVPRLLPIMKFGETLYQRSVPKWAAYNLNYNELKHLIKQRTTNGAPTPVPIPGQSDHRWSLLEDELYGILKEQYEHIVLFTRSKYGEIERRLAHLDKSVRSSKRSANLYSGRPSLQARKYQRLAYEAENIGEDIQALSRFAATQKTAFRKILKKYRKWTNSDALRARLETEVFSDRQLDLNLSGQMQHLATHTATIEDLQASLLRSGMQDQDNRKPSLKPESPVSQIVKAAQSGPLHYDAAMASIPFGEAAGTATYWVHKDNLDEARVLLLRYMRDLGLRFPMSRENSTDSLCPVPLDDRVQVHACYLDNAHRFVQDSTARTPSRAAVTARWSTTKEALVTMSDLSPRSDGSSTISIKRKDLTSALDRTASAPNDRSASAANTRVIKDFLSQHRDVKPLAQLDSDRTRYAGLTNSSEVGTFATFDDNITFGPFSKESITSQDEPQSQKHDFPHAVLEIRWEFGRKPEVVRAFDSTHLAERVADFTLESAAIYSQVSALEKPSWTTLLEKDIRKVPMHMRASRRKDLSDGLTSGPSSVDGPMDSVFSTPLVHSTTGSETSNVASPRETSLGQTDGKPVSHKKKRARILAESPNRRRYYSEYDDPDSEFNQQDTYTIYVDPNQEAPGMATIRKIGSIMAAPFAWVQSRNRRAIDSDERTSLLNGSIRSQDNLSSESESDLTSTARPRYKGLQGHVRPAERYRIRLSRRQRAFERTLVQFYSGLLVLSYIFLLMSAILLNTGRRKEVLEVDVGATVGVVVALACTTVSLVLVYMRKEKLATIEILSLCLGMGMIVVLGAAVIVGIVQKATHGGKKRGSHHSHF